MVKSLPIILIFASLIGCSSDSQPNTVEPDASTDLSQDLSNVAPDATLCETRLFGLPAANTGLTDEQCGPSCGCSGAEKIGTIPDAALIAHVQSFTLETPMMPPAENPYESPAPNPAPDGTLCAAKFANTTYTLATYPSIDAALAQDAVPTHFGACGLCSPLQDLGVYMAYPDLTTPVRQCGLKAFQEGEEAVLQCIRDLGFTEPCAQIWFYNTMHTREACLVECVRLLNAPYHNEDGSLNECILCDELKSGDVFKAIAGRTRRNTGLPSALCRPCDEVQPLPHVY